MTGKDIELIKKMLQMQAKLDEAIMKEYELTEIDEEKLCFAILDEVGELTHELKGNWCWWKKTQPQVDDKKVLGELVDIWHFVLSWQNNFNGGKEGLLTCEQTMKKVDENRWSIEGCRNGIVIKLADLASFSLWKVEPLIAITEYLGFTIERVYEAYCGKNKINYQRLKEGY
jgi:dimeric dUTPase (all-alpha-NTP-PPase superfamily)